MPSRPDRLLLQPRLLMISVALLLAAGFGLTLLIFYPGVMTYDAKFVYQDIAKGTMGDWQSPVMVWLWALIDPVAPDLPLRNATSMIGTSFGSAVRYQPSDPSSRNTGPCSPR